MQESPLWKIVIAIHLKGELRRLRFQFMYLSHFKRLYIPNQNKNIEKNTATLVFFGLSKTW